MLFVVVFAVQHLEYLVFRFKLALIPTLLFFFLTAVTVMIVSIFVQWGSLLCLSVIDVIQTYQQTLLFYVDQHHQQTNTIGVSESGLMLVASLEPVFVPFIHLRWCFHQRYRFSILDIFKL